MRQIPPGSPRRRPPPYCALRSAVRRSRVLAAPWRPELGAREPRDPRIAPSPLRSARPRAPASDREAGGKGGRKGDEAEEKGKRPARGAGRGELLTARREGGCGHPRQGRVAAAGWERAPAPRPLRTPELLLARLTLPLLPARGAPPPSAPAAPSSFPALPLLRPAPRAGSRAPQWLCLHCPAPEPPLCPLAWASSESSARLRSRLSGPTPPPASGAPAAAPAGPAPLADREALGATGTRAGPRRDPRARLQPEPRGYARGPSPGQPPVLRPGPAPDGRALR